MRIPDDTNEKDKRIPDDTNEKEKEKRKAAGNLSPAEKPEAKKSNVEPEPVNKALVTITK